jgi:hypothetical protein
MPDKENVVEHAVAFALLRQEVAALTEAHRKTDEQIQGLLDAWNASKWVVRSVAAIAGFAATVGGIYAAWRGIK